MSKQEKSTILAVNGQHAPSADPNHLPMPLEGEITVRLSTGRVVDMVIGELTMFYELGEIPDELTPVAAKILFATGKDDPREVEKRYFERLKLARWTVGKVVHGNTTPVERLYHSEIWEIYDLANAPALALDNFRRYQEERMGTVSAVQDLEPSAESAAALAATA